MSEGNLDIGRLNSVVFKVIFLAAESLSNKILYRTIIMKKKCLSVFFLNCVNKSSDAVQVNIGFDVEFRHKLQFYAGPSVQCFL